MINKEDLNKQQLKGYNSIIDWITDVRGSNNYILSGYAGTGKTTIISILVNNLGKILAKSKSKKIIYIATLTWKAAHVLRHKGIKFAQSIHSLIYKAKFRSNGSVYFVKKTKEELNIECALIIIDEASMIDNKIKKDLESYDIPILYVGDKFQLPAINDKIDFLSNPDFHLTEPTRQAKDSEIIKWSRKLINFEDFIIGNYNNEVNILSRKQVYYNQELMYNILKESDITLCGINKTRKYINELVRKIKGIKKDSIPNPDEPILLFNSVKDYGLYNSDMININSVLNNCDNINNNLMNISVKTNEVDDLPIDSIYNDSDNYEELMKPISLIARSKILRWSFGYCCTTHKSQGSEWDNVFGIDESYCWKEKEEVFRMKYTMLTRASKKITILI